jgi:hypothetical protein
MFNIFKSLFKCKHNKFRILGHTDEPDYKVTLHKICLKCGEYWIEEYNLDDPYVDEDSPNKRCGNAKRWSGYSWWLHEPMTTERLELRKNKVLVEISCKK